MSRAATLPRAAEFDGVPAPEAISFEMSLEKGFFVLVRVCGRAAFVRNIGEVVVCS